MRLPEKAENTWGATGLLMVLTGTILYIITAENQILFIGFTSTFKITERRLVGKTINGSEWPFAGSMQ